MDAPDKVERRDPCAPVLRLGAALAQAHRERASGVVDVVDRGVTHRIRILRGSVADVSGAAPGAAREPITRRAARLFELERPKVLWTPRPDCEGSHAAADPDQIVIQGVRARADLFDPRRLVERIPVSALCLRPEKRALLDRLELADDEYELALSLRRPTPVALILWKRGVEPRRAGALLVALNLVGAFDADWHPGLLPRLTTAIRVLERARAGAADRELLGAASGDDPREEDKAFRRLTLELHPDRLRGLPREEVEMAEEAFRLAGAAYDRLKRSRRSAAPVGVDAIGRVELVRRPPSGWREMLEVARRCARDGDLPLSRAYALKALALSPSPEARAEIVSLLTRAA
jgi:hypothetical protein